MKNGEGRIENPIRLDSRKLFMEEDNRNASNITILREMVKKEK